MRGHVVMVGLGSVGMEVLEGLVARGRDVVVVERDEGQPLPQPGAAARESRWSWVTRRSVRRLTP